MQLSSILFHFIYLIKLTQFMKTNQIINYKHLGTLLCLLFFTSLSIYAKGDTPYSVFSNLWQKQVADSSKFTLLTEVPLKTLTELSPLLEKKFKVKNHVDYGYPITVSGILTTLLKEKYGKKSNEKNDFFAIQYSTNSSDFENYLNKYPKSKYAEEATARLECFKENEMLHKALNYGTRNDYEEFVNYSNSHPRCNYEGCDVISKNNYETALAIKDWLVLTDRSKGNNPEIFRDYSKYLEQYGSHSVFSSAALDSMNVNKDRYDWQLAKNDDSLAGYREYVSNHSDGKYKWTAKRLIQEYEMWEKAQVSGKYEDYCSYYSEYPDGKYVEEAINKLKLEEDQLWNKINKKGNRSAELSALESFVAKYPSGYYANEAQNRITELRLAPYLEDSPSFSSITEAGYYSHPGYSLIGLANLDNGVTITVSLTGPTGYSGKLKPGELKWVKVKNGSYKILVQASNTNNWWGTAKVKDRVYTEGWFTSNTFNGFKIGTNEDPQATKNYIEKVKAKVQEEEINTLMYIYGIE